MALVTPSISGTNTADCVSSGYAAQNTNFTEKQQLNEPNTVPDIQDDPIVVEEENKTYTEPEEVSPAMPQEDEDPATSPIAYQTFNHGKSNPQGQGFLRNLLRKTW